MFWVITSPTNAAKAVHPPLMTMRHNGRRLAVASFVDARDHVFGVYSVHKRMAELNMSHQANQIVITSKKFRKDFPREFSAMELWLGNRSIYEVDTQFVYSKLGLGLWKGTFNKLWLFNRTEYDLLIVLDGDVLIRHNILHWFDYPAPAATQPKDQLEWNSGAMVIRPDTSVFDKMMDLLPKSSRFKGDINNRTENWNSGYGDQGFLSSFFTSNEVPSGERMHTMPQAASILSSSIRTAGFSYFMKLRRHIIETVHFTIHKPYRYKTKSSDPIICGFFQEWKDSLHGIENYIDPIPHDYLRECPPTNISLL